MTWERRPAGYGTATTKLSSDDTTTIPTPTGAALLARRHQFAIYVLSERADGRIVGQVYTSLPAAERKAARTRERGLHAVLSLVELRPVGLELDTTNVPSTVAALFGGDD